MNQSIRIANHFRRVYFGGNWTAVCLEHLLSDISLEDALISSGGSNSIAALTFHMHYFVSAIIPVLEGGTLDAHDKNSFNLPEFKSEAQWQAFITKLMNEGRQLIDLIEALPENKLYDPFTDPKYGDYYDNLLGIIEHTHYHLGQIAFIKKTMLEERD